MFPHALRKASRADVAEMASLYAELANYHNALRRLWDTGGNTKEQFARDVHEKIDDDNFLWIVVEVDDVIAGFFSAEIIERKALATRKIAHISNAYLRPPYRHHGIAGEAMVQIRKWLVSRDVCIAEVSVDRKNQEAIRVWRELGFKDYVQQMWMIMDNSGNRD